MTDRARAAWRLMPFEIVGLVALVSTLAFLRGAGLRVGWEAARYSLPPVARHLAVVVFLWSPALHVAARLVRRQPVVPYLRETLLSPRWLLTTLRVLAALVGVTFAYMWLKVSIPLVSWTLWDRWLWRADAATHLGVSPSAFSVALFESSPTLLRVLDSWYGAWTVTSLLGLAWFLGRADQAVRVRVTTSMLLIFTLSSWAYLAMPALGPCYVQPEVWAPVRDDLPQQTATQHWLWDNYEKVVAGRRQPLRQFNPNLGVAAMPSMHVAAHALIALWALRLCRPLFVPAVLGTLLTLIGSVVTGWHYALDGYAGLALAVLGWWAAGHLGEGRLAGRAAAPEESPPTSQPRGSPGDEAPADPEPSGPAEAP